MFSGPAAQLGIQMRNGIKAYLDAVNEKGGVHGRKIELVTEDDRYESVVAPSATKSFWRSTRCSRSSATSARRPASRIFR